MNTWVLGALDRAIRSGLQVLLAYLSTAELIGEVDWLPALAAAGFAVLASMLTSAVSSPSWGEQWIFQVAERATKTFLQAVAAGIGTATMFDQVDWSLALQTAALAAVYSVVTSVLTTRAGLEEAKGQVDLSAPSSVRAAHMRET